MRNVFALLPFLGNGNWKNTGGILLDRSSSAGWENKSRGKVKWSADKKKKKKTQTVSDSIKTNRNGERHSQHFAHSWGHRQDAGRGRERGPQSERTSLRLVWHGHMQFNKNFPLTTAIRGDLCGVSRVRGEGGKYFKCIPNTCCGIRNCVT